MAYDIAGALRPFNPMNAYAQGAELGRQETERREAKALTESRKQYGKNYLMAISAQSQPEYGEGQSFSKNAFMNGRMLGLDTEQGLDMTKPQVPFAEQKAAGIKENIAPIVRPAAQYDQGAHLAQVAQDAAKAGDWDTLAEIQKLSGTGAEFGMNPQQGIDPNTGRLSYFVTSKQGQPRFLDIEAQPKPVFQGGFQIDPASGQPIAELPMSSKDRAMMGRQDQQLQVTLANLGMTQQRMQTEMQEKAQKQQLELQARDNDRREAAAATDIAMDSLNTLTKHPGLARGTGSVLAPIARNIPGTDEKGFAAQLEQFKSQTFLPAVQQMKGMGQLSNAEGAALQKAVGNLDPDMPTAEFQRQAAKIMAQMRAYRQRKFGDLPATTWDGQDKARQNSGGMAIGQELKTMPAPSTMPGAIVNMHGIRFQSDGKSWLRVK